MRILFLGNNWVGWQIVHWLKEQSEEVIGLVIHPCKKRKYGEEIIQSANVDPTCIFNGARLDKPATLQAVEALRPDIAISALFGYILRPEFLDLMPAGCVNIHHAFLPQGRGSCPNVWSIIDGTSAGVTLHYMDAGIDTGEIIAQREVSVEPIDTGKSLYRKLEQVSVDLFKEAWPLIRSGRATRTPQQRHAGTYHRISDLVRVDEIDLNRSYLAKDLINVIRARTFSPYEGAYFWHRGRKVYLRLELLYEEQLTVEDNEKLY